MIRPDSSVPSTRQPEVGASDDDPARVASAFHGFLSPSCLGSGPDHSSTIRYAIPVNNANFDPAGVQDHYSAFVDSSSSFDSNDSDAVSTPVDQTLGNIAWISSHPEYGLGPTLAQNAEMNNDPQVGNEVSWYSGPSDPLRMLYTTSPKPQASTLGGGMEDLLQTNAGPSSHAFAVVEIPPEGWGIRHPEACFSPGNPSFFNFANPTLGIDGSSYPIENVQGVGLEVVQSPSYTAVSPSEELSRELLYLCEWKDDDGAVPVCGDIVTRGSLPQHLANHGIKNMTRTRLTKCKWVGCKSKKPMNRESIVRHIREVHMRLKRPSKSKHF